MKSEDKQAKDNERELAKEVLSLPNQELNFHYSREKRLAMPNAPGHYANRLNTDKTNVNQTGRQQFFKKNKFLLILFIDILLVSVILLFYNGLIRLPWQDVAYKKEKGGFTFTLRGLQLKDRIIANLTIKKVTGEVNSPEIVSVRFLGYKDEILYAVKLPDKKDEEQELTETLSGWDKEQPLKSEISLGKETFILSRALIRE